jgi:hypothetical protein
MNTKLGCNRYQLRPIQFTLLSIMTDLMILIVTIPIFFNINSKLVQLNVNTSANNYDSTDINILDCEGICDVNSTGITLNNGLFNGIVSLGNQIIEIPNVQFHKSISYLNLTYWDLEFNNDTTYYQVSSIILDLAGNIYFEVLRMISYSLGIIGLIKVLIVLLNPYNQSFYDKIIAEIKNTKITTNDQELLSKKSLIEDDEKTDIFKDVNWAANGHLYTFHEAAGFYNISTSAPSSPSTDFNSNGYTISSINYRTLNNRVIKVQINFTNQSFIVFGDSTLALNQTTTPTNGIIVVKIISNYITEFE